MNIEVIHLHEGVSNATLTAYIQDASLNHQKRTERPAVIICPGGAFLGISEKEAEPVALKFLSAGYQVFVLRYSIGAGAARFPAPFIDAAKAVKLVRENAARWGINQNQIALCGFSTGGYVAAVFAASWQEDYLAKALGSDNKMFQPNALLLGYPLLDMYQFKVRNMEKSPEMQPLMEMVFGAAYGTSDPNNQLIDEWSCINRITPKMPPTFLWMTAEDTLVDIEEGFDFIKALKHNKGSYEFHVFQKGAHGLSLGDQTVGYSEVDMRGLGNAHKWVDLALNWLAANQRYGVIKNIVPDIAPDTIA